MPAFRGKLSAREVGALVAYVRTVGSMRVPDPGTPEAEGFDVAFASGCFGCHGDAGMGGIGNPGSFKGYIPGWRGADYGELVASDAELREWIEYGGIPRLSEHSIAKHFVRGQIIKMPRFKDRLTPEKIEKLMAYVKWVRLEAPKEDANDR